MCRPRVDNPRDHPALRVLLAPLSARCLPVSPVLIESVDGFEGSTSPKFLLSCLLLLATASAAFAQPTRRVPAEFEPQEAIWLSGGGVHCHTNDQPASSTIGTTPTTVPGLGFGGLAVVALACVVSLLAMYARAR